MAWASASGSVWRSPCGCRRRSAPGGAGRARSARSDCAAGSRGTALGGRELHAGAEPALHDGEVAGRQVRVEVGHEAADSTPGAAGQRRRIDARARDDDHPELGDEAPRRAARRR